MPTLTWQIQITNPNLTPIRGLTEAVNGLRAATGQAATSIDTLTGHTQALSRQLAQTGQAAQQHGSALVGFFQQAASAAAGFLAANVLQQIVGGLTNIGQAAITSAASMEQTRAGFTTLLGSAQQADALIAQLQQEANKSPFELANFRQGAQLLLGMGVAADQIVPRLHNVSNVVAAVGGTPETFNRITLALGQIQAKGKVSAEEINQLAENGVPGWDILAQALGKTRANVIDLSQQGKLSADVWNQAFTQFAQSDRISKAADAQSHTFNGLLSTIRDIGTALGNAFGGPLIAAVEPTLERIVTSLQDPQVTATLAQWGAAAGQFVTGLIQAGEVAFQIAGQILGAFKPVTDALGNLFGIKGGPAITLPDFQPVVVGSSTLGTNLTKAADSAKSVKDQIAELERTQRESSRASAEQQETYTHQKDGISEQIRLLQEKYDLENRTTDRAELAAKIRKDEALAVDVVSSQGQAAAKRLVDERAQLRQLDRKSAFDTQKGALEDQARSVDAQAQLDREKNAKTQRTTQDTIDKLRAGQQDAQSLSQVGARSRRAHLSGQQPGPRRSTAARRRMRSLRPRRPWAMLQQSDGRPGSRRLVRPSDGAHGLRWLGLRCWTTRNSFTGAFGTIGRARLGDKTARPRQTRLVTTLVRALTGSRACSSPCKL
jgi:tape measure domain-containing protein